MIKLNEKKKKLYCLSSAYIKLEKIVQSREMSKIISQVIDEVDSDSILHIPDEEEINKIIKQAINERLYEPYVLLEKRLIQLIKLGHSRDHHLHVL